MQQLTLLETSSSPQNEDPAVWNTLDEEQRALVVAVLARLIVKLTAARRTNDADKERDHD